MIEFSSRDRRRDILTKTRLALAELAEEVEEAKERPMPSVPQAFPIGSIYLGATSRDPAQALGYGTWTARGSGSLVIGLVQQQVWRWERTA